MGDDMNNVITYYIPVNSKIDKGAIYTLYLNNNKNLDLSSILEEKKLTLNNVIIPFKENKIILEKSDYDEFIFLNNNINIILNNLRKNIDEFNKNINELANINIKYVKLFENFGNEMKL